MPSLTSPAELQQHVTLLASIEETDLPFVSCYLNLEHGRAGWRDVIDERARILRRVLKGKDLAGFEDAIGKETTAAVRPPKISPLKCMTSKVLKMRLMLRRSFNDCITTRNGTSKNIDASRHNKQGAF